MIMHMILNHYRSVKLNEPEIVYQLGQTSETERGEQTVGQRLILCDTACILLNKQYY